MVRLMTRVGVFLVSSRRIIVLRTKCVAQYLEAQLKEELHGCYCVYSACENDWTAET